MEQILRRYGTRIGTTLSLFLMVMTLAVGGASAAPIADPDFTTLILNPADLQKYVSPLPNAFALKVAPDTATFPNEDYYRIDTGQFNHDVKLNLLSITGYLNTVAPDPGVAAPVVAKMPPTPTWGYGFVPANAAAGTAGAYTFPGPTIVNTQGRPTRVTFTNSLPATHVVALDPTLACGPPNNAGNVNGPLAPFTLNAPFCMPQNRVVPHPTVPMSGMTATEIPWPGTATTSR